ETPAETRTRGRTTTRLLRSYFVRLRRLLDALTRLFDQRLHDRPEVAGVAIHIHLAFGAGAIRQNFPHVLALTPALEPIDDVVDEGQQLEREVAHRHLAALAEVDQLAVDAPPRGAPLVLFDQRAMIAAEAQVPLTQPVQLDDDRLRERSNRNRSPRR